MAESPASWKKAEFVIENAIRSHYDALENGIIGWSLTKSIAEALRGAGLLRDEDE